MRAGGIPFCDQPGWAPSVRAEHGVKNVFVKVRLLLLKFHSRPPGVLCAHADEALVMPGTAYWGSRLKSITRIFCWGLNIRTPLRKKWWTALENARALGWSRARTAICLMPLQICAPLSAFFSSRRRFDSAWCTFIHVQWHLCVEMHGFFSWGKWIQSDVVIMLRFLFDIK